MSEVIFRVRIIENVLFAVKQISDTVENCTETEQAIVMTCETLWQFEA